MTRASSHAISSGSRYRCRRGHCQFGGSSGTRHQLSVSPRTYVSGSTDPGERERAELRHAQWCREALTAFGYRPGASLTPVAAAADLIEEVLAASARAFTPGRSAAWRAVGNELLAMSGPLW